MAAGEAMSDAARKAPRFPQLTLEELNEQQRPLGQKILSISRVGLGGPYNPMLRSPVMAQRMYDLLDYLRWNSSLPARLTELAILIVAREWRSQVEWYAHEAIARKTGLKDGIMAALKAKRRPEGMQPDETMVYDFCSELLATKAVSDATFARAKSVLGEQQVIDLTTTTGTYVTIAMILSVAEATVPEGAELPFKPGEP